MAFFLTNFVNLSILVAWALISRIYGPSLISHENPELASPLQTTNLLVNILRSRFDELLLVIRVSHYSHFDTRRCA